MPFINIKMAGPEPTKEQKQELISQITQTMVSVLGKKRERVQIYIETFDASSIGTGGMSLENVLKESK
ncbi:MULTISPECIES: tautomerase family protein [Campylobacter]|uniref:Tautomerase n=1 Tax=Campylobacter suis TaxID=2790657 RepID=A0ABM8Q4S6_9BACT|nr:4-oxalocrotonate tautomerase family protein [Campylobacter suis]CAD7287871.1 putative tautomerase [Campylobacter suis]